MVSTKAQILSCESASGYTAAALHIVERVEREIVRHEGIFGHDQLLRTVAGFGGEAYATHTGYYRRVIRETMWPHGTWVGSAHADFLRGYMYSALGYVWGGFEALSFFAGSNDWSIDEVYDDALVAESLRGQFGKSSPDGLDRRLAQLEDRFIAEFGDEDDLILICTPIAPIRTAEAAMLEDFKEFRSVLPKPPTIQDVLNVADYHRAQVWKFLRRHVRWNVGAVAPLYDELVMPIAISEDAARAEQSRRWRDRALSRLPAAASALADAITSLNVLNLVLEPAFSFKGCVGLPLGMIFRMVQHAEHQPPLDQVKLLLGKWNLFTLTQHWSNDD